jgi:hypothetical protein
MKSTKKEFISKLAAFIGHYQLDFLSEEQLLEQIIICFDNHTDINAVSIANHIAEFQLFKARSQTKALNSYISNYSFSNFDKGNKKLNFYPLLNIIPIKFPDGPNKVLSGEDQKLLDNFIEKYNSEKDKMDKYWKIRNYLSFYIWEQKYLVEKQDEDFDEHKCQSQLLNKYNY